MSLIIEKDGRTLDSSDYGIKVKDIRVPSIESKFDEEEVKGVDGKLTSYNRSDRDDIEIDFDFFGEFADFPKYQRDVFRLFRSKDWYYLKDARDEGLRWRVYANPFTPEQNHHKGIVTVAFTLVSPYPEDVDKSEVDYMVKTPSSTISGGVVDLGIVPFEGSKDYNAAPAIVTVDNEGDEVIDPRSINADISMELDINLTQSDDFKIINHTTGDEIEYEGEISDGDTFRFDGVRVTRNGSSVVGSTNFGVLTLDPGENEIEIELDGEAQFKIEYRQLYV